MPTPVETWTLIRTPMGFFEMPAEMAAAYRAAPKRKDGSVDRRYSASQPVLEMEAKFVEEKRSEFIAAMRQKFGVMRSPSEAD